MDASLSKLVTPVYYRYNQLRFPKYGMLELTQHDTVRVVTGSGADTKVEFEVPVTQIQRLRVWRGILMRLRINGHTYWIDENKGELRRMQSVSAHPQNIKGAEDWVEYLKTIGIHAQSINLIKIAGIMTGAFILIQAVLFILSQVLVEK